MDNQHYQALLCSLLAVLGGTACDDGPDLKQKPISYIPGEMAQLTDHSETMPDLPCLPSDSPRLKGFNPDCMNEFRVIAGPTQSTNPAGKPVCSYTIAYDENPNCIIGRPLVVAARPRIAALEATSRWL